MLALTPRLKIYVHLPPTDFRKSFNRLTGLVRSAFQADHRDGAYHSVLAADPRAPHAQLGEGPRCNWSQTIGC